jgi:hypothetical protein
MAWLVRAMTVVFNGEAKNLALPLPRGPGPERSLISFFFSSFFLSFAFRGYWLPLSMLHFAIRRFWEHNIYGVSLRNTQIK